MPNGYRHWCFTLNNPTADDLVRCAALATPLDGVRYFSAQHETAPDTGTPHIQGYIEYFSQCSRETAIARLAFHHRPHVEARLGTADQAAAYTLDPAKRSAPPLDLFYEGGTRSIATQGTRSDLANAIEAATNGASLRTLWTDHPSVMVRYGGGVMRGLTYWQAPPRPAIQGDYQARKVVVICGPTGLNKTGRVWRDHPPDDIYPLPEPTSSGVFVDGYCGQPVALIDDFGRGYIRWTLFLKMLDRYPLLMNTKGGTVWWNPSTIYITSNVRPSEWFPALTTQGLDLTPMFRRITETIDLFPPATARAPLFEPITLPMHLYDPIHPAEDPADNLPIALPFAELDMVSSDTPYVL